MKSVHPLHQPMEFPMSFDRITTGFGADMLGTFGVHSLCSGLLNPDNPYACLLTHHRVWQLFAKQKQFGFDVFLDIEKKIEKFKFEKSGENVWKLGSNTILPRQGDPNKKLIIKVPYKSYNLGFL